MSLMKQEIKTEEDYDFELIYQNDGDGNWRHKKDCPDCGAPMELVPSQLGEDRWYYRCTTYPDCRGSHGAHPDGSPLGIPADAETREYRKLAHAAFDKLWNGGGTFHGRKVRTSRPHAYRTP